MSSSPDMSQYLGVFLDEAQEQVALLESELLRIEAGDQESESIQSLFRAAHTLKGSSRAMGFTETGSLAHEMENVLEELRCGTMAASSSVIDALLDSVDCLKALLTDIGSSGGESAKTCAAIPSKVARLAGLRGGDHSEAGSEGGRMQLTDFQKESVKDALASGLRVFRIAARVSDECPMKAVRAFMALSAIEAVGTALATYPAEVDMEAAMDADGRFCVLASTHETREEVLSVIAKVPELDSLQVDEVTDPTDLEATGTPKIGVPEIDLPPPAAEAEAASVAKVDSQRAAVQTVRVGLNRLDSLLNLVGELVVDRTQVSRLVGQIRERHSDDEAIGNLGEALGRISRVTSELQDEVMKTRMLPIDGVFQRMPRMVRDLAVREGKEINLRISGGENELDRSVLETLSDPLIHILRNAVDHGIESPELRVAAGKSPEGSISLSARYEDGNVVVEIEDDGKGIDPAALRVAAVQKGLISSSAAQAMSDREALGLIAFSGFSTAGSVSDVSGRGVGMDIVKTNLDKIGGRLSIDSRVGEGTRFSIHLPLTLAIVRALLVAANGQTFIVPLSGIVEILKLGVGGGVARTTVVGRAAITLRGDSIPLVNLADFIEGDPRGTLPDRIPNTAHVVLVKSADRRVGLCVDGVLGEQAVVAKPLGRLLGEIPGLGGASIMSDGKVALIVDVQRAIEELRRPAEAVSQLVSQPCSSIAA